MEKKPAGKPDENARLRGDLLTISSRVSHDLRTPLGGIITNGEALKEMLVEHNLPVVFADSLIHSAEEISRMIKRISLVTRASAVSRPKELISMCDSVAAALQRSERLILQKQASMVTAKSWPKVPGVDDWLEVIWSELLANALQHAGESPKIELGWRAEGENIRFWVSDNGPGVSGAVRDRLFQNFNSLHELNSTRGFGLAIVQRLVELQCGTTGYDLTPEGRAEFYFTLPTGNKYTE